MRPLALLVVRLPLLALPVLPLRLLLPLLPLVLLLLFEIVNLVWSFELRSMAWEDPNYGLDFLPTKDDLNLRAPLDVNKLNPLKKDEKKEEKTENPITETAKGDQKL